MSNRGHDTALLATLAIVLAVSLAAAACLGAYGFSPGRLFDLVAQGARWRAARDADAIDRDVLLTLRLPRVLAGALTGAILGACGAVMQGLFRNPIVEPGLTGTSAGAAFGAALVFVFGVPVFAPGASWGLLALPVVAFAGALCATLLTYRVAASFGRLHVFTLLLAGIAINAACNAGSGLLSYFARDPQARNITFWSLGTFTTASWSSVLIVALAAGVGWVGIAPDLKSLNALMLGEDEALALGVDVRRLTRRLLVLCTMMVAAATATVGVIAFVGLVVPHALRLIRGSNHEFLVPASALLGASFMLWVDVAARLVIRPGELPIGVITAVVGAPVFLLLLLRAQRAATGSADD
ncbi:MAG TPA: iron ABC transporter permease [Candidatus Sulfotelmatobacter sp.]|nr:iron ABC transporter permease [Candidatus Sulfotelmatobacter sp.]